MKSSTLNSAGCAKNTNLAARQATHRRLLDEDAQYRGRFYSYLGIVVCLSCVLLVFYLPFFSVPLFAPAMNVAIILALAVVIVGLTLRQFHYQRKSIRHYLESNPPATSPGQSR
jgi:uncharacterized membrane protein (DUF485 family)